MRRLVVTDELVALFRAAIPHARAWWQAQMSGKDTLTLEERLAARDATQALDVAVGRRPWELPLTDPDEGGELQAALLAKFSPAEIEEWQRFASRRRKYLDRQAAKHAKEYQARVRAVHQWGR